MGASLAFKLNLPTPSWLTKATSRLSFLFLKLLSKKNGFAIFTFGFCTLLLPCGRIIAIYSLIALECTPFNGLLQGALFALITSPALVAAMHATRFLTSLRKGYHVVMGAAIMLAGTQATLRGAADLQLIDHLVLNPAAPPENHLVLF